MREEFKACARQERGQASAQLLPSFAGGAAQESEANVLLLEMLEAGAGEAELLLLREQQQVHGLHEIMTSTAASRACRSLPHLAWGAEAGVGKRRIEAGRARGVG
nr:unnamed protein product [Digitaria exilis]